MYHSGIRAGVLTQAPLGLSERQLLLGTGVAVIVFAVLGLVFVLAGLLR